MRLYTRTGASALTDPDTGRIYEANAEGGFDFPDDLSDRLHKFAVRGQPMWETDIERQRRLMSEELERRKDPATLLSAVEKILNAAKAVQPAAEPAAPAVDPAPIAPVAEDAPAPAAKAPRKRAAAKPAAE
jgi:hypothetical protein